MGSLDQSKIAVFTLRFIGCSMGRCGFKTRRHEMLHKARQTALFPP
jgi:hypothetical protein